MRTKEMVKLTSLSKDTLRFYEEFGILSPNRESYARDYTNHDVERIGQIKQLKALDFSLDEIKQLVDFDEKYQSITDIKSMSQQDQIEIIHLLESKMKRISEKKKLLEQGLVKLSDMRDKLRQLGEK